MRAFFCHSRAWLPCEESRFFSRSRMKIDNLSSIGSKPRHGSGVLVAGE
jgi:hypothetical protein